MATSEVTLERAVETRVRAVGQRYTRNRRALVEVLAAAGQPLTIVQILERRPGLAQSSAYRNLLLLEHARVVHRIVTTGEFARFELAEDLTDHHHHLVCASCGDVVDVPASRRLERRVREAIAEVEAETGFAARGHRLDVIGVCRRCD